MNTLIETLAKQAGMVEYPTGLGISENTIWGDRNIAEFAELIIQECVAQCRQEWYDLNNADPKENETSRDIGIRVGQKNGVLKTISRITQHFGIE